MKRSSIIFLQIVIVLIAIVALALLIWEPQIEGVNAHSKAFSDVYLDDPFLILVYVGSIPFFVALYKVFKLLGYVRQNKEFSPTAVKAIRIVKYCAFSIIGFVMIEEVFIILSHGSDDAAGGIFMGVLIAFGSIVVATVAAVLEKLLQKAVEMKSENDLTV